MTSPAADAAQIAVVILDIDGVLTDGRVGYGAGSDEEIKFFFVRDGLGLSLLRHVGLKVGALSARLSGANARRARELSFISCTRIARANSKASSVCWLICR